VSQEPTDNDSKGHFLGWSMTLWGGSIDATNIKQWNVPKLSNVFPPLHPDEAEVHPVASASISSAATSTKTYIAPTVMLPENHTEHEGEAEHPAFPIPSSSSASAPSATHGGGWMDETANFVSDQKYLIGAMIILFIVMIGAGILLQRKLAVQRRRAHYAAVPNSDRHAMRALNGQSGPHNAGDRVVNDEDADEETGLRAGLGYHSEFLHDDDVSPVATPRYRDEPEGRPEDERSREARSSSDGNDSGSGGSWEHASKIS
jgi:kexin